MQSKTQKIAIIGPEYTGKTTLANKLAKQFEGTATEEYARGYFEARKLSADHVLSIGEMCEVMAGQRDAEQGEGLCFIDASCIHGALYAAMKENAESLWFDYESVDAKVMDYATGGKYDAIILCRPHVELEWENDGLRAMPNLITRHAFAEACHAFITEHYGEKPVIVIDKGNWPEREEQAFEAVKELL